MSADKKKGETYVSDCGKIVIKSLDNPDLTMEDFEKPPIFDIVTTRRRNARHRKKQTGDYVDDGDI